MIVRGNNMRIGLVQVHRDHDAADTFLNLGIASGGQDEPVRIENKMCIGRALPAKWNQRMRIGVRA